MIKKEFTLKVSYAVIIGVWVVIFIVISFYFGKNAAITSAMIQENVIKNEDYNRLENDINEKEEERTKLLQDFEKITEEHNEEIADKEKRSNSLDTEIAAKNEEIAAKQKTLDTLSASIQKKRVGPIIIPAGKHIVSNDGLVAPGRYSVTVGADEYICTLGEGDEIEPSSTATLTPIN